MHLIQCVLIACDAYEWHSLVEYMVGSVDAFCVDGTLQNILTTHCWVADASRQFNEFEKKTLYSFIYLIHWTNHSQQRPHRSHFNVTHRKII